MRIAQSSYERSAILAKGLKPTTAYRVYCDDVDVTAYCTSGSASTNNKGEATILFSFNAPQTAPYAEQNFLIGRHTIRVTDGTNADDPSNWTMLAEATDYRETLAIEKKLAEDPLARERWMQRQLELDPTDGGRGELVGAGVGADEEDEDG